MPGNVSLPWYEFLLDKLLSAIDNVIGTPVNNLMFFWSTWLKASAPGADPKDPYASINDSEHATGYKLSFLAGAILTVIGAMVIFLYKKFRAKESISHYFLFERLFSLVENTSENFIHLHTAAHFYNPDISPLVLCLRRVSASLRGNSDLKNLEKYLTKTRHKTKEILLQEIYKEINEQLALFITNKKKYGNWSVKGQAGAWLITPPPEYVENWRIKKEAQENEKRAFSTARKTKKTNFSRIFSFINFRLEELGKASFFYWIGVFIFYFLPGVAVVGGTVVNGILVGAIAWPPVLVAGIFLGAIWITKIYIAYQRNKALKHEVANQGKAQKATFEFIMAVKHQIQLDALLEKKIGTLRYEKIKFKQNSKESRLCRDIREVLGKKCTLVGVRAVFNGFITGCFIIFFSAWLINSAVLVIVALFITLSPATLTLVAAVVALVTLGLGLCYGIYFAVRKYHEEMGNFLEAEAKFLKLQKTCGDLEIPDISLRECDRLFRRGTTKPSSWTFIKQGFKRAWTGAIRLGTGILFLKLLPMGTALAVLGLLGSVVVPTFYLMLILMLAGGVFFAACHIWQYHRGSQEDKAERVMDFFLNRPYVLESNHSSTSPILVEAKNKTNLLELRFEDLLNKNELCFERLRRISSESRLNYSDLNGKIGTTEKPEIWQFDGTVKVNQHSEDTMFRRKRSSTFSGLDNAEQKRKQGIHQNSIGKLRLITGSSGLFREKNSCSGSMKRLEKISLSVRAY